ncbi:hypothetical protein BT93_L4872 [Corymbia citriodora subsp. variegata]|uniref:DASH complex subunit Hsk3 like-domain-containing protein n=1 Tax=Corymbia citriodora subsp. variegata TaxID=360336 RepID=A0A8T0CJN2_CORYI|nr:hypothetical protein BT93_L4872 [Corymbia citriodora subsp. variegata]
MKSQQSHHRNSTVAPQTTTFSSTSLNKQRQYTHLHAQLAQLNAHLADTENLVRMTAVQALDVRFLGGYVGALMMGSARVLGEGIVGEKDNPTASTQDKESE